MFNFLLQGKVGEMMAPVQSPEAQLLIAIQNKQAEKVRDDGERMWVATRPWPNCTLQSELSTSFCCRCRCVNQSVLRSGVCVCVCVRLRKNNDDAPFSPPFWTLATC